MKQLEQQNNYQSWIESILAPSSCKDIEVSVEWAVLLIKIE